MNARALRLAPLSVALLALVSSAVGIVNKFTYDDRYIVEQNPMLRGLSGWLRAFTSSYWPPEWGSDGYRPLTIIAFKLEYLIGGGSPIAFHAANIALYAVASVLVLRLATQVLSPERHWAAWLTAALFAVHPVHVEAVANVVGQSELIVAIAVLAATILYLRDRIAGPLRPRTAAWIALLYALGCLAKEHAIVLPAILVAAEVIVLANREPFGERLRTLRPFYLLLLLVAVAVLGARSLVLSGGSLGGFQPFMPFRMLKISNGDRVLTALGVVPEWVRLFFWPARLSSEYGPPDIEIAQGLSMSQIPGLAMLLAILTLGVVLRRREPAISFGIAFVVFTLLPASNFILPAGIVLAERTLFLPSVGAMIVAGGTVVALVEGPLRQFALTRAARLAAVSLVAIVLTAGAIRSALRTTVWYDNSRLFQQAAIDSPLTYRAYYILGAWHFENKRRREGEAAYRKALSLFPYDPALSFNMAEEYRRVGLCGPALPLYRWTTGLEPRFSRALAGFAWCLLNEGQYEEARQRAFEAIRTGASVKDLRRVIFITDSIRLAGAHAPSAGTAANVAGSGKVRETVQKTVPSGSGRGGG